MGGWTLLIVSWEKEGQPELVFQNRPNENMGLSCCMFDLVCDFFYFYFYFFYFLFFFLFFPFFIFLLFFSFILFFPFFILTFSSSSLAKTFPKTLNLCVGEAILFSLSLLLPSPNSLSPSLFILLLNKKKQKKIQLFKLFISFGRFFFLFLSFSFFSLLFLFFFSSYCFSFFIFIDFVICLWSHGLKKASFS